MPGRLAGIGTDGSKNFIFEHARKVHRPQDATKGGSVTGPLATEE